MLKRLTVGLFALVASIAVANAQNCGAYPNTLTNGTSADANQVMANFNAILNCVNNLALVGAGSPGGRLTLTAGNPVMSTDVSGATVVYYAPYTGSFVPINSGTSLQLVQFTVSSTDTNGISIALGSNWGADKNWDAFVAKDGATVRLCTGPDWSVGGGSNNSRGIGAGSTELQLFNGIWTNKNALTCRYNNTTTFSVAANQGTYVGTFRTTATAGQTEFTMSPAPANGGTNNKLFVWNAYNRVPVLALSRDNTASWTYASTTWRKANGSNSNAISYVDGLAVSPVDCRYDSLAYQPNVGTGGAVGCALNYTSGSPNVASVLWEGSSSGGSASSLSAAGEFPASLGFNTANAVEVAYSTGGAQFYAGNFGTTFPYQAQALTLRLTM